MVAGIMARSVTVVSCVMATSTNTPNCRISRALPVAVTTKPARTTRHIVTGVRYELGRQVKLLS